MRAAPTSISEVSDKPEGQRSNRFALLSLGIGCLVLIGAPWSSLAPAAQIAATGSAEQLKSSVDFTSIDLLTRGAFTQRDDLRGEIVSLHQDVLLPVPVGRGCVRIEAPGLRLDRIYQIRYRPEKIALELTNVGAPRRSALFEATLTRKGSVRRLYGRMPELVTGTTRRLLLSASTPIAGERMIIRFRP